MADITENVVVVLSLRDEASAATAKATAAAVAYGEAAKAAAEKANAATRAKAAVTAAADAELIARASVRAAGRAGTPDEVRDAAASLAAAKAATAEAKQAQAEAEEAFRAARTEESGAKSAVAAAEREAADAAKAATAAAEKQAVAVRETAEAAAELTRQQQVQESVVGQLDERVAALSASREAATAAERVGIDAEIASLERSIAGRRAEIEVIGQKREELRGVAALAAATSEEERAQIKAEIDARRADMAAIQEQGRARQAAARAASGAGAGAAGEGGGGRRSFNVVGGEFLTRVLNVAGVNVDMAAMKAIELGRRAMADAREAEASAARLAVALDGNVERIAKVDAAVAAVASHSVNSQRALIDVAQRLLERGVKSDQIPQALQVIADTAAALQLPLDEVASELAQTFGGTVPRALGRAVPALHNLSDEARRSGGALDVLAKAYSGRAAAFAATDVGRELAADRDIKQAWEDIGKAMLPIEREILPALAEAMKSVAMPFKAGSIIGLGTELKEYVVEAAGHAAYLGKFISNVLFEQPVVYAKDLFADLFAHLKSLVLDLLAFVEGNAHAALLQVAGQVDSVTAKLPSWLGGKTALVARVQALPAGLANAAAQAAINAGAADGQIKQDQSTNVLADAHAAAKEVRRSVIDQVQAFLGVDQTVADALGQQQAADAVAGKASAVKQDQTDRAGEGQVFEDLLNVRQSLRQKDRQADATAELATIKDEYAARTLSLEQYYARRRQLELGAIDQEMKGLTARQNAALFKVGKDKLAGRPATEDLKELLAVTQELIPLEEQRAKAVANIAKDEQADLRSRQQRADELAREDAGRQGRARATLAGDDFDQRRASAAADLADLAAQQQAELNELKGKGATADQLDARAQTQAAEMQAKRVELARQLAQAIGAAVDAAKQEYQASVTENADLVRVGQLSPDAGRSADAAALAKYQQALAQNHARITGELSDTTDASAQETLGHVKAKVELDGAEAVAKARTLAGDIHASLEQPLAGAFDKMLETQGGFSQRLRAGVASFVESISQMLAQLAAKLAANAILNALLGPSAGQGQQAGDDSTKNVVGTGLLGGVVNGIGRAVGGAVSGAASSAAADAAAASAQAEVQGLISMVPFATGGYTGHGHPAEQAGVVHRGEYVLHARAVQRYGVANLDRMNAGGVHPDALAGLAASDARMVTAPSTAGTALRYGTGGPQLGSSAAVPSAPGSAGGGHTFTPMLVLTEQVAAQFGDSQAFLRAQAKAQINNPAIFKPVHAALGPR